MTISNLIRKGGLAQVATATPTTLATREVVCTETVAPVATVAVAELKTATSAMTEADEAAIRGWLSAIEETDENIIEAVLSQCRGDHEAYMYFLKRASEIP